jgi:putative ABC transport system substrate-binding protein
VDQRQSAGAHRLALRRRDLMTLFGSAALTWPLGARAQQRAMPVIGYLGSGSAESHAKEVTAFRQGLEESGYAEGQNLTIDYRWAERSNERFPALAADLVNHRVDLIVTAGGSVAAQAAKGATSTIPIVFAGVGDPVAIGLVAGLARPGGNVTGISNLGAEMMSKRLQILSELVPNADVLTFLTNPKNPNSERVTLDLQAAARAIHRQLLILKAGTEGEIDAAFGTLVQRRGGGLVLHTDPFFITRREQIVALASRYAVPVIEQLREFAVAGGLISYGSNQTDISRQAGIYAGKILNGAKPADLPVQQPTAFELVINLNTAKALGLTVPQSMLMRADEVLE